MLLTMTDKELHRIRMIEDVIDRRLSGTQAARHLGVTARHVYRLVGCYKSGGVEGLLSERRGKPSNRSYPVELRSQVLAVIREHYHDFGPKLISEKLAHHHEIHLGVETLRRWMIAAGIWVPHSQRKLRIYQPRQRRDCLGELIQIDGSHHDWFEGRSPKCCLLVFIDDATGRLMHLRFSDTESTFDYLAATRRYIELHGRPVAFYSDRHSIFHVSKRDAHTARITQYGRALQELNIELICANSSQAKGRVEQANQTLQDRLIKEMRLEGINTIEEANEWLPCFIADFNDRFAKVPKFPKDLHRPFCGDVSDMDDIFAWHGTRVLSNALTFQYDKVLYLIDPTEENSRLSGETVKVLDYPDGRLAVMYGERILECRIFDKLAKVDQGQIVENKRLGAVLSLAQKKQDELERADLRTRSRRMPKRRAQQRAIGRNPALE
ncbi:transposase [Photobacterium halotolerans]|uniref:Transposase n=2 Tax=Photobacterium halotolerans TaxID=265726 RepID=A0A0F5V8S8_9GAMM|nr:transposase [Photobacterium halotolerans]